jgi:branched-chain amino acid transport system substrate-binding protein
MSNAPIRIGYCLSLSGGLAANGLTAQLAHQIWQEDVNSRGGILNRPVELVCVDDKTDPTSVLGIYKSLLADDSIDLLLGGYGNNSISPAMPLIVEHGKYLVGLMGLAVNKDLQYDRFFCMIPTGSDPNVALTSGLFEAASTLNPKPRTMAILAADAPFSKNPIEGARANAAKQGIEVLSELKYDLATDDYSDVVRQQMAESPDILFLCSYINDSAGLLRAVNATGVEPMLVGGAMIGPQSSTVQEQLGPLLNGVVNYEYWLPTEAMAFSGVQELITKYQGQAKGTSADALGYYVAPCAYAQLQVVEQAIAGTGGLDDAELAAFTHSETFHTVMGNIGFSEQGEWDQPRVLTVQFQNIRANDIEEFRSADARVVVAPGDYTSGSLRSFGDAKKSGAR